MQSGNFDNITANMGSVYLNGTVLDRSRWESRATTRGQSFLSHLGLTLSGSVRCEEARVIDFQVLLVTCGILLLIVALTTLAAIGTRSTRVGRRPRRRPSWTGCGRASCS